MSKTIVVYHAADYDGIFCREIAKKFLPEAELIGWDYGDLLPIIPKRTEGGDPGVQLYMLDISVDGLMDYPGLIWIDHHKSAIEKFPKDINSEKKRTMLHFGAGDIHITDARMKVSGGNYPLVIFHEMTPHQIGSSRPELHGTECDDFAVGMTFSKPESIDALIDVLRDFKAEHFPLRNLSNVPRQENTEQQT